MMDEYKPPLKSGNRFVLKFYMLAINVLEKLLDYLYDQTYSLKLHTQMFFLVGDKVRFKEKVFKAPYTPYYDGYKDKTFVVAEIDKETRHLRLTAAASGDPDPKGWLHDDEIELVLE